MKHNSRCKQRYFGNPRGRKTDALYRTALEWDLTDPIVIENRDDLKSEPRWRDRMEPYHHQVTNLITFCRRLPVTCSPTMSDSARPSAPA